MCLAAGIGLFGVFMAYQPTYTDVSMRGEMTPESLVASQNWLMWTAFAVGLPFVFGLLLIFGGAGWYVLHVWRERSRAGAWG